MMHEHTEPDQAIVEKFDLTEGAVPVATLGIVWFLDDDGEETWLSKFDGRQRVSVTVGDLTALIHEYLRRDDDNA